MSYEYSIEFKNELTIEQICDLLEEFHGEPRVNGDTIISKTICHNPVSELNQASHKLYYYDNTHLFHCYTGCSEPSFDIFELTRKVKTFESGIEWTLSQAIRYVAQYFGYSTNIINFDETNFKSLDDYWIKLNAYNRIKDIKKEDKIVELKTYDEKVLKNLPHPHLPWEKEGITAETCNRYGICYNPKSQAIVIPHYNEEGKLIGIRERTLIKENAEIYGKYRPAYINNKMYNHPLSFALYGLNMNKDNIRKIKKAIVFESEKAVLQYDSYFGPESNISVACCGSNLITYQLELLLSLKVNEIIIAFDHDFEDIKEDKAKQIIERYKKMYIKYGNIVTISFIWDRNNLTGYKDSPIDCGKEIFISLFKERVNLYQIL